MGSKALKDSFELCQKILRNRRERTRVNVTLLKSKPLLFFLFSFFLRVIFHISFGKQLDNTDQTP